MSRGRRRSSYTCTINQEVNENTKEFPMYIAMADLCITPTGFTDTKLREALCSKINLMCGEVSMAYTSRTTHLLSAHANTTKVELARERNLPVVTVEWIENIWNACKQNNNPYIHASLSQFQNCDFPIFFNLHFTFSKRYDMDTKQFYEGLLTLHGGTVGTTLLKKTATHFYICQEPESEHCYQYSQEREIPCIPLAWIIESIDRKTLAKIAEYEIRGKDLVAFGTTFDVCESDQRLSLPGQMIQQLSNLENLSGQPNIYDFDPTSFLEEIDNFVLPGDTTKNNTTLLANEITCDGQKMDEEGISILDETVIEVNEEKDSLVDSLTFSLAG